MFSYLLLSAAAAVTAVPLEKRQTISPSSVPSYVISYAPVVHLFSGEPYNPSDIGAQVSNTSPKINYTAASGAPSPLTLDNLNQLNSLPTSNNGQDVYLTSNQDPTTDPSPQYLYGVKPDSNGSTGSAISSAIVTVENTTLGYLDAFYFYFYAFNYGGSYPIVGVVDDHIGDWEHNMIRFNLTTGLPISIWYSQPSTGEAFTYSASQKYNNGQRPVTYSANGTHANYATPGTHDHTIPGLNLPVGPIEDHTDAGAVWDPTIAAYYYSYDAGNNTFTPYDESYPVNWLYFNGRWGDDIIPQSDSRQDCPFGEFTTALCKYTAGPTGPADKDLVRTRVCPDSQKECNVLPILLPKRQEDFERWI